MVVEFTKEDGSPVWINPEYVVCVERAKSVDRTELLLDTQDWVTVTDSLQRAVTKINQYGRSEATSES